MKVRFTLFLLAIIVVASPAETFQDDNILAEEDEDEAPVEVKRGWKEFVNGFKSHVRKTWDNVKHFGKSVLKEVCGLILDSGSDKNKLEKRKRNLRILGMLALKALGHFGSKVARNVCESKVQRRNEL